MLSLNNKHVQYVKVNLACNLPILKLLPFFHQI